MESLSGRPVPLAYPERARHLPWWRALWNYGRTNWILYLLGLPGLLVIFLIRYIPMFGLVVAFEDFRPETGFLSKWVGFRNFDVLFNSPAAVRLVRNTVVLNGLFLAVTLVCSILVALLLNEIRIAWFKKITQSLMFLPFFVSWSVVAIIVDGMLRQRAGTLTPLVVLIAGSPVDPFAKATWWPWILTIIRIWKDTGASCIIYLAVLTSINPELYEAAAMDGVNRIQRVTQISLPLLVPTIILMTLLAIGRIFYGDFGMIYTIIGQYPMLYTTTDVIDTYLIRALQSNANFGMSTAMGFLQALLGFVFVYGSNWLVKRYSEARGEDYSLF
jgi:putative aldouronate transport system permease protein